MVRIILGILLALLAIASAASGPSGLPLREDVAGRIALVTMLGVPAALLCYFGWYARAAKTRLVTRPHAAMLWGFAVLAAGILLTLATMVSGTDDVPAYGMIIMFGAPAAALFFFGGRQGTVQLMPVAMRAAQQAEIATRSLDGPDCAICGAAKDVSTYRYFPPVSRTFGYPRYKVTYSSGVYHAVRICNACIEKKRSRAKPAYWIVMAISLPLCIFFFGIIGVLLSGSMLYDLRNREEIGDTMAYEWFSRKKIGLWVSLLGEGALTRKGFARTEARQGRDWLGRPTD